jgi:pyruvate,water dikinase
MRRLVEAAPMRSDVLAALSDAYARLCRRCGVADVPVAVRSSAVGEDAPDASFAGEHDSSLWVQGEAEVLAAVRRCWSSLFTERAIAYRHRIGFAQESMTMAVAVQQMVRAEAAGVAFTLSTRRTGTDPIAIEASWGFGEAVVGGEVTPDNYLVDKVLNEVTRRVVSEKAVEYRLAADGRGISLVQVPEERRECRAWATTSSRRWPGWPGRRSSTTAVPRTSSGQSKPIRRLGAGYCLFRASQRRCGVDARPAR